MFITITIVRDNSDLDYIINRPLELPLITIGDNISSSEQLAKNMWAISLDPAAIEKMSLQGLIKFVTKFLEKKIKQISQKHISSPVVFYMWFDEMAAQLRFNTISAFDKNLPFGCKIDLVNSPESILEDFLKSQYHDGIPWGELEQLDDDLDEDEKPFVLKVYVAHLN